MTEEDDVWQPQNPTDFRVYDVPTELKNDYISMAKLHYDDDVWKVMADAMAALKEDKFSRVDLLEERIESLQQEVSGLKGLISKIQNQDEDDDLSPTFGGS
jgi:uncharacterized small protein (DUF1192 family)